MSIRGFSRLLTKDRRSGVRWACQDQLLLVILQLRDAWLLRRRDDAERTVASNSAFARNSLRRTDGTTSKLAPTVDSSCAHS